MSESVSVHVPGRRSSSLPLTDAQCVVLGGGPAGATVAKLLADWGHDVQLFTRTTDPARALANSLPPSTRKLLVQAGMLEAVERVGYPTTGNTVWWGDREGRVELFADDGLSRGYQVARSALDPLLLDLVRGAGAHVASHTTVQRVEFAGGLAHVTHDGDAGRGEPRYRLAIDASGRAGVVGSRHRFRRHLPADRMQALLGVWRHAGGWDLPDPSHTVIETYEDGWAWSIPVAADVRHVGVMLDGGTSRLTRGPTLEATYRTELGRSRRLRQHLREALLDHVWACDASVYDSETYGGAAFLLVGDAGSTINPLSSFGVKKSLASAWLGAVVANTMLTHPERYPAALDFFNRWERRVYAVHLERSRDFAREAFARHPSAFWQTRADAAIDRADGPVDEAALARQPALMRALEVLRSTEHVALVRNLGVPFARTPIVHEREIVLVEAVPMESGEPRRHLQGVDLVALAAIAPRHADVGDIFEAYRRAHGDVPLPSFLSSLSLLVARGVLTHQPR